MPSFSYFQGPYIYKYGVERRQALNLEAALVTPVTPRVISNPRVRLVKCIFIFDVSAECPGASWVLLRDERQCSQEIEAETTPRRDQSCKHFKRVSKLPELCALAHILFYVTSAHYEFFCVHSNPIWKGRNCRDYRPSHLTWLSVIHKN